MDSIKTLLAQIQKFWAGKDGRFKRNAIVIASIVLAVITLSSVLLNHVDYATLYSGLDPDDASAVITALNTQKEPYQVTGDTITVPAKDADRLRMSLSSSVSKKINLDILQQGQGLGMTESDKQDYRMAQLEANLQSAIMTLDGVKDATVIITMPADSVLVIDNSQQVATAGVILTLENGVELSASQIKAIEGFVQKAVPGLKPENISVMDSNMQSLDVRAGDDFGAATDQYTLQNNVEASLRRQVMALLLPIFGMGHVEAEVNATLNFDDKTTDSTTYAPVVDDKNGVVISYDNLKEQIDNGTGVSGGQPGTSSNTGTSSTTTYPTVSGDSGSYLKTEDKVNLEVNSIVQHLQQAKGSIKDLSVSVVIDNTNMKNDLTDNVKSLVKNAVGVIADNISVEYMPMQAAQDLSKAITSDSKALDTHLNDQQNRFYMILGAVFLAFIVVMMLLFTGKKGKKTTGENQAGGYAQQASTPEEQEQLDREMDAIKIVKDSGAKEQIGALIQNNPELVANLLRSWLADEQE